MRNITEQKHARDQIHQLLDEKVTLLKEVQHRIKNNLSTMTGPAATAALNEAMFRFKSMQLLYDHLYRTDTGDSVVLMEYLQQQVSEVMGSFRYR